MKRWMLLGLVLVALGAAAVYLRRPPLVSLSLLSLLPQANRGPLLAPRGNLGAYDVSPFLERGWDPIHGEPYRSAHEKAELLWSQTELVPVVCDLEARSDTPCNLSVSVNSHTAQGFTLGPDFKRLSIQLAAADLVEGLNHLWLDAGKAHTQWCDCRITPLHADYRAPGVLVGTDQLCFYYGSAREFPLLLLPRTDLVLDDLVPWIEPGSPAMEGGWELTLRVQSGSAHLDRSWSLTTAGRHRLHLPVDVPTQVSLTLMARAAQEPLPGQKGLVLVRPRLDSWSPAVVPPAPSPVAPPPILKKKPNILLYLIDTLRYDHLHCDGYSKAITPHIDALAGDGVRFLDCMAAASWTKPSTASMLTSMIAHHHRTEDFGDKLRLKGGRKTLAEALKEGGYETRGVNANPLLGPNFEFDRGFDSYTLKSEASANELNAEVLPWLARRKQTEKPFFLYVHAVDTHMPYFSPTRFLPPEYRDIGLAIDDPDVWRQHKTGGISLEAAFALYLDWHKNSQAPDVVRRLQEVNSCYDGGLASCDEAFGQLVDTLKQEGLYENTIIVLVSDHGEEFFDHGAIGHLKSLYQELMHIPLIIKLPQNQAAGTTVKSTWQNIDIAPTLLAQTGTAVPATMEGKAYSPSLPDGGPNDRPVYFSVKAGENIPVNAAIFGDMGALRKTTLDGVRVGPWVLIHAICSHLHLSTQGQVDPSHANFLEPLELYDLANDPTEHHNLVYSRPEVRVWLESLLKLEVSRRGPPQAKVSDAERDQAMRAIPYLR